MQRRSISAQLLFYFAVCLAVLIGVSSYALLEIVRLNAIARDLTHHQLPETRILGEMADLLGGLRMDQTNLALAVVEGAIAKAELSAARHLAALETEVAAYLALPREEEEQARLDELQLRLRAFVAQHDAWIAQSPEMRLAPQFQR